MKIKITVTTLLAALLLAAPARAAEEAAQPSKSEAKQSDSATKDDQLKTLAEEIRRLKLELGLKDVEYQSYGGLGPAASKVYFAQKGLSIGGYGEVNYQNDLEGSGETDLLRAVVYLGYRFNPRIVFNSEIEFEHAGHEVSVEFAYLDFLLSNALQVRVGNMLLPLGITNELHEPAFFNGVFRPDVETRIIPTTWNENGVGLHGDLGALKYQAMLVNGLDLLRKPTDLDEPVENGNWLRRARTGSAEARAATFAGVLGLEYDAGPLSVGGSFYGGRADQRRVDDIKATVTITELHARFAWKGLSARVLGAVGTLGDADEVNAYLNANGGEDIHLGSRVQGGYAEVAYDVLSLVRPGGESSLSPFVRFETYDLNAKAASGFERDPGLDVNVVTAGLTYKPLATVVLKADYQRRDPKQGDASDQVNVGAGFVF